MAHAHPVVHGGVHGVLWSASHTNCAVFEIARHNGDSTLCKLCPAPQCTGLID